MPKQKRQDHRRNAELRADRQSVRRSAADREILDLVRWAEIDMREFVEIDEILLVDRLVEVIGRFDIVLDLGRQMAVRCRTDRPAQAAS